MTRKNYLITFILASSLFVGCSGGGGSSTPSSAPSTINLQPQAVNFTTQSGQHASITISGGTPPYTITATDPRLVSVAPTSGTSFTISPEASGSTTVRVNDSASHSADVSVSTPTCEPPGPEIFLSYPANNATGVPTSATQIWVADPNSDPGLSILTSFALRLLGSNGSSIDASNFATTSATPPPGSSPPPSGPTYTYATSDFSGLQSGLTYQIQEVDSAYPCMPPTILGQFST